jgi:anti-anti-sigma regulatory factor
VDSSILRILLGAHRQATAQGGEVVLLCGPGFVRRLLFLLEIDRIVRVCAPEDWRETASTVN